MIFSKSLLALLGVFYLNTTYLEAQKMPPAHPTKPTKKVVVQIDSEEEMAAYADIFKADSAQVAQEEELYKKLISEETDFLEKEAQKILDGYEKSVVKADAAEAKKQAKKPKKTTKIKS
jgi:hypothetical protein